MLPPNANVFCARPSKYYIYDLNFIVRHTLQRQAKVLFAVETDRDLEQIFLSQHALIVAHLMQNFPESINKKTN